MDLSISSIFSKTLKKLHENVNSELVVRRIIERFGIPLIKEFMIRRFSLKVCNLMANSFSDVLNKNGIQAKAIDNGRHVITRVWIGRECWDIDLTAAQYLCDIDEHSEVEKMIGEIELNPWKTIKYQRQPQGDK